jgi:ATP-dependent HslUV protease ATP-binding subunit HslU
MRRAAPSEEEFISADISPAAELLRELNFSPKQLRILRELSASGGGGAFDDEGESGSVSSSRGEEKAGDYDSKVDDFIRESNNSSGKLEEEEPRKNIKPSELVKELDKHIVGQNEAKRAVAVSLRNRYRRHLLSKELREEIMPKNILMIGPTGSGKTEIARRLAKITDSPFIKVEATKFTEVGFYGKDVDSIIKDLLRLTVQQMKAKKRVQYKEKIDKQVEEEILNSLAGPQAETDRESLRNQLKQGLLDKMTIEIDIPSPIDKDQQIVHLITTGGWSGLKRSSRKKSTIAEARPILTESLMAKAMSNIDVSKAAIRAVEQDGIVFLDEIDKICSASGERSFRSSADASAEGVQRDLLPLVEGTAVTTNLGTVHTDHILFICSGAFHSVKPSDLLPELQGRLPIRVELKQLTEEDLYQILTVPINNLIKQQIELLKTDNLLLNFSDEAVKEIAKVTAEVNKTVENIGARRLNTVIQRICDELSFSAADEAPGTAVTIDRKYVLEKVTPLLKTADLSKYVL